MSVEHVYMVDRYDHVHSVMLAPLPLEVARRHRLEPATKEDAAKLEAHVQRETA